MSDEDLRKWDSEVRGNVGIHSSSSSLDSPMTHTLPVPSVSRLTPSQRLRGNSGRSLPNKSSQNMMVTVDNDAAVIGVTPDDIDVDDDGNDDDDDQSHQYHYSGGRGIGTAPDSTFAATQLIHLTRGNTAYKIIESDGLVDERGNTMDPITIVCLHGLTDSSYIWEDIAEVLSSSDAGPCARVVVFDFYGRGR